MERGGYGKREGEFIICGGSKLETKWYYVADEDQEIWKSSPCKKRSQTFWGSEDGDG